MRKITGTYTVYRRSATSGTVQTDEARKGDVYREFIEVWEKSSDDERGKRNRRVSQVATGNVFRILDVIKTWRGQQMGVTCDVALLRTEDIWMIRLVKA
jgi:hypothetical protein